MERSDYATLWNDSEKFGNGSSECEEDGIPECELDTTENDGIGGERDTHWLRPMDSGVFCELNIGIKFIAKYFFSADVLLLGACSLGFR
jgi:hypothetical protein